MLLKLFEENPNPKILYRIIEEIRAGEVIIYPTDSVYAIGCDITNVKAVQKVAAIKGVKPKANFSIMCKDLSEVSKYAKVSNDVFKLMKSYLPGPYTFILPSTSKLPNQLISKRKEIGIRIPDNNIVISLVEELGNPLLTTSIPINEEVMEYMTDPELIHEEYENKVSLVVDGGIGNTSPSTVLDCTGDEIIVVRQGIGEF